MCYLTKRHLFFKKVSKNWKYYHEVKFQNRNFKFSFFVVFVFSLYFTLTRSILGKSKRSTPPVSKWTDDEDDDHKQQHHHHRRRRRRRQRPMSFKCKKSLSDLLVANVSKEKAFREKLQRWTSGKNSTPTSKRSILLVWQTRIRGGFVEGK